MKNIAQTIKFVLGVLLLQNMFYCTLLTFQLHMHATKIENNKVTYTSFSMQRNGLRAMSSTLHRFSKAKRLKQRELN